MQERLTFIAEDPADWHLDDRTRIVGRQGIEAARRTLASCRSELASAA